MDRPNLSRDEIVEILLADVPWHPMHLQGLHEEADGGGDPTFRFWEDVFKEVAHLCASRLLTASYSGSLLNQTVVKQRVIEIGRRFGWPGFLEPLQINAAIEAAGADVLVAISPIDLVETHASCWERLSAIVTIARLHHVPRRSLPDFLRTGVGRSMILCLSTTPEAFRAHQQARIDAKRPEAVEVFFNRLLGLLRAEFPRQVRDIERSFLSEVPRGREFWKMRAWWLHWVEVQIDRVWPGCALGSTQAPTTDA